MAYNQSLFERYQTIAKLPTNRRGNQRRSLERRRHPNLTKTNQRNHIDRRINDRRVIQIEVETNADLAKTTGSLRTLDLFLFGFPNATIVRKRALPQHRFIIDIESFFSDGHLHVQSEIQFDPTYRFAFFKQLKGDFQSLRGDIELIPSEKGTKIKIRVLIEPGLPSFETIFGHIFKSKIRSVIREAATRAANRIGGMIERTCDFGFLVHTIPDYFTTTFSDTSYAKMPDPLSKYFLRHLPPFKCAHVTGIKSILGPSIEGNLIYSPYAPSHFLELNKGILLQHLIEAGEIAKGLGAKIVGLGAYTAFIGRRGLDIASALQMPVTTGTAYTIATALKALEGAAHYSGIKMANSTVTIVGASGSIGKVCAELLLPKANKLILVARNLTRLNDLARKLQDSNPGAEISCTNDLSQALLKSRLILMSTNTPEILVDFKKVLPGTIICDLSQPRNVSAEDAGSRNDVLVIDGGVVEPPGNPNFNFYFGLPPKLAYACIAETAILALEKRYESFSIGGNISVQKVMEIEELGEKHGFKLAELKSFGHIIRKDRFKLISNYTGI